MATRTQWVAKCTLAGAALVLLASCDRTPTDSAMPDGMPDLPRPSFAVGDVVAVQPLPFGFTGNDVGIGFDGVRLFYNDHSGTNLLIGFETTNPPTVVTSVPVTTTHLGARQIDLDAMAFDITRNVLWAVEHNTEDIYMVDRVTGVATFAFSAANKCVTCIGSYKDGLAFDAGNPADPTDDALWWSYDVDHQVFKLRIPDGATIESFNVDPIHADLAECGNSGIAVGGQLLYLGTNGCNSIVRINKVTKAFVDALTNLDSRPEDMECDPVTFFPTEVMWVREFEDPNNVVALEIEPGSCGLGGAPPQPPCPPEDDDDDDGFEDDDDNDGLSNKNELLFGLPINIADSDGDGVADGNDDSNGNGEDDEDEDDDDECPDPDEDGDGEDDEDEDDDDEDDDD
jgi:hypothetical protein